MKKTILLFLLLGTIYSANASDTLTVRRAFDLSVGDTIDFQVHVLAQYFTTAPNHESYSFFRKIITAKTFSVDSQTITYTDSIVSAGYSGVNYAEAFDELDTNIIAYDTTHSVFSPYYVVRSFNTGIDSNQLVYNTYDAYTTDNGYSHTYTEGLGLTYAREFRGNTVDGMLTHDTSLVYYYKNGIGHGTPYYSQYRYIHVGINDLSDQLHVRLYPNPATDILHIDFSDGVRYSTRLILTDLLGQEVYSSDISDSKTTHDISHLPSGIYTWRISTIDGTIKTGKIIKQ